LATQLPVPVRFELPDGWESAPPDEVGARGAAFVALNTATLGSGFTANITLEGSTGPDDLTTWADESVRELQAAVHDVTVADRHEIGSPDTPGLAQDLRVTADVNGVARELAQFQVYFTMGGTAAERRRAVVRAVLTCAGDQVGRVLDDFRSFVGTLTADTP
jgi:hypothetical protein